MSPYVVPSELHHWGKHSHTSWNSYYKWKKISALEITIFVLKMMIKSELEFFYFEIEQAPLGGVHKLRLQDLAFFYFEIEQAPFTSTFHKLRLQDLAFFEHLSSSVYIFYGVYVYKNSIFLTTSSCKHSLWTAP